MNSLMVTFFLLKGTLLSQVQKKHNIKDIFDRSNSINTGIF